MTQEAMKLALEWIEKQPEEITVSKYDDNSRYVVIKELEAALANQEQDEPVTSKPPPTLRSNNNGSTK